MRGYVNFILLIILAVLLKKDKKKNEVDRRTSNEV